MRDRRRDGYVLTNDAARVDVGLVHRWLCDESYWAAGRAYEVVARSLEGSAVFDLRRRRSGRVCPDFLLPTSRTGHHTPGPSSPSSLGRVTRLVP